MDVEMKGSDSSQEMQGSVLSFHDIGYSVTLSSGPPWHRSSQRKDILVNVSGLMRPGMNAILGPTGSGKSSLLDVLADRKDPSGLTGEVLLNGDPLPHDFKFISGYVVQDDVVMGSLTVRENFQFSAALRLPTSVSHTEKEQRVERIISELGLTKVADSKVGTELVRGVSGGERKRTNIGMELITDPSVLFLDEPTTGLDSSTASAVLLLLRRLSRRGRTIIFSIHQPRYSIFRLFDSLTLLVSGHTVYHGPSSKAIIYFKSIGYECEPFNNPADFFLDVLNGDSTAVMATADTAVDTADAAAGAGSVCKHLAESYAASFFCRDAESALRAIELRGSESHGGDGGDGKKRKGRVGRALARDKCATSFLHQFAWLSKRNVKNLIGNPQASLAQVVVTLVLGLVVGALFFDAKLDNAGIQNRMGSLFFMITNQMFGSLSAIELFVREHKIFIHEYVSGYYRVSAYFFSKILSDLIPMRTIPGIIFSCVTFWMIGFQARVDKFFIYMLTVVMTAYGAVSLALAVSAGTSVVAVANVFITVCFIFMILFSGFLVNLPSVMSWLSWLQYLSIPGYGFTGLLINEFTGLEFLCRGGENATEPEQCPPNSSVPLGPVCTGAEQLCRLGIRTDSWSLWKNHVALGGMILILLTIAYLRLRFVRKYT
ncbi:broad substrate specificity ATP-binding cassette transporter ABCG2-like isoform X1 [Lethenteron reissneri]|uniref:broad substrate specificity ATP-binding cassette transporter ABCG2-like isoform X1 n=1 Tax=Lethenteron reissneri TaxID=7753 RepID=UPI002AB7DA56|nr:broad substrate specificity ATP-binding cassette transporter ABCG2-like isoform X1 [Lethenteron reissneri]